jgi:SnoaL-like domain
MTEHHTVLVDDVVRAAHQAMQDRDWDALRGMLHPYLHWTAADGSQLRGRTKVMDRLQNAAPPAEPVAVELRDGQIYRWQEPPDDLTA